MEIDRQQVIEAFKRFTSAYDASDSKIALKITHTLKVAELCARIAESEGMSEDVQDIAWLAGMLHDVGRFEQIARYGTFSDASSLNHAALSAQLLFDEGVFSQFCDSNCLTSEDLHALKTAIELHSAYKLPDTLPQQELNLCNLLRDADKVDIMRVMINNPITTVLATSEELARDSEVSPDVLQAYNEHHAILTAIKKTPADYVLGQCALGWELVYPESRRLVLEQGYLSQLFDRPFDNAATQRIFKDAKTTMMFWLNETA